MNPGELTSETSVPQPVRRTTLSAENYEKSLENVQKHKSSPLGTTICEPSRSTSFLQTGKVYEIDLPGSGNPSRPGPTQACSIEIRVV